MIELTTIQRRSLRAAAHPLHPVVSVSQKGLSETVLAEIDRSLQAHELIKVKLHGIERDERVALQDAICERLACASVQRIGNILVLWREKPDTDQTASKPRRSAKPLTKKQAAAALEAPRRRTIRT